MTRIVAALPWYDETPAFLDRCVRSLWWCNELVALDGRWDLYDDGAPILSPAEQAWAIGKAADAVGLDHEIVMGPRVWGSQVEKRKALMDYASELGDWIFVVDADEHVDFVYPERLERRLGATDLHVASIKHVRLDGQLPEQRYRRLFRQGTTVMHAHNGYRYGDEWLLGDTAHVDLAAALDASHCLGLYASTGMRPPEREEKAAAYKLARRRARLEVWR